MRNTQDPIGTGHPQLRWRFLLCAACLLVFCSCRGMAPQGQPDRPPLTGANGAHSPAPPAGSPDLPPQAWAGSPPQPAPPLSPIPAEPIPLGAPLGAPAQPAWAPPGIAGPWPQDEYVVDGGDLYPTAAVRGESVVHGANPEDTVAHFETPEGDVVVEPSNRVFIYAPRFAAVRQVVGMRQDLQATGLDRVHQPTRVGEQDWTATPGVGTQNQQAIASINRRSAGQFRTRQGDGLLSEAIGAKGFSDAFKPYEDISLIREGSMLASEFPLLAEGAQAAHAWMDNDAVEVMIDHQKAAEEVSDQKVHSVFVVGSHEGTTKLRLTKVASTQTALPGDMVDFTLRFDNVGTEPLRNVVVVDNLNARLEYVPGSAQASVETDFSAEHNEAGSVALRWALQSELAPGDGGIIRFQCRVR